VNTLRGRDFISLSDLIWEEIGEIFVLAQELKVKQKRREPHSYLTGKTLVMIFHKPSARTRISFETGMYQLGGKAINLMDQEIQMGRRESVEDIGRLLSRYNDAIMIRTFDHHLVEKLAVVATIPVINGLTDREHPCQVLTDIFTLWERKRTLAGLKVVFVGDGNNVAHSWFYGAALTGINFVLASPPGYAVSPETVEKANKMAFRSGARLEITQSPLEAVREADVIYTDAWVSMGQEKEREVRLRAFKDYQVNSALLEKAKKDVLIMHCLPAHRGEEITDEIIDGPHSIVFEEAENRLHVQKALLVKLIGFNTE